MPRLSIIVTVLNDNLELNETIRSIRATTPGDIEIIVIDDGSEVPATLEDKNCTLVRNANRIGVGGSRHIGATLAASDHLLIIDSHMRFVPGWFELAIERITRPGRENVVHCGCMLGLDSKNIEIELKQRADVWKNVRVGRSVILNGKHVVKDGLESYKLDERSIAYEGGPDGPVQLPATARYYGARLNLLGPNPNNKEEFQIFEGVWNNPIPEDDSEISCLMGACYFFPKKWFFHIGGLKGLKHWGSDEPYASLKTYLAGGSVRMMNNVLIGHKFYSGTLPYTLYNFWKHYNKMRSIQTCTDKCEAAAILKHFNGLIDVDMALNQLVRDKDEIRAERDYNSSIFVHDLTWFCQKFGIKHPLDA